MKIMPPKKIIRKISKIALIFLMALNLSFYQTYPAIAQELLATTQPEEAEDDPDQGVEAQEEEDPEEPADVVINTDSSEAEAVSLSEINTNTITDITPEETGTEAALEVQQENQDLGACICENIENYPEEDPCLPKCEEALVQQNEAEKVDSLSQAVSDSGGNSIIAEDVPELTSDLQDDSEKTEEENSGQDEPALDQEADAQSSTELSEPASASIDTGDSAAAVLSVAEINTNIVSENGEKEVINITEDYTGDINLLDTFNSLLENAEELNSQNEEALGKVSIVNINDAVDISNTAEAMAGSGGNTIENVEGEASVMTGAAKAVASAVNIINTNIVGDNWLFVIINILGDWTGDLIVPGEGLLNTSDSGMRFGKVTNINEAEKVEDSVSASSGTGGNSIEDADEASITAGEAKSVTNAASLINTNIVKNNWFFLMINNAGNWLGKIVNWAGDSDEKDTYEYDFGSLEDGSDHSGSGLVDVYNYNRAVNVTSMARSSAYTGNNSILGSRQASISTGNAEALASAFGMVNTNIVGNNWFFGVVNNAGNWDGDVIFAYPDLAVGVDDGQDFTNPGKELNYSIDFSNLGKADSEDVRVSLDFPKKLDYLSDTSGQAPQGGGGGYSWDFSGLKAGEKESFSVRFKVDESDISSPETLAVSASVGTATKEVYLENNSSEDETLLQEEKTISYGEGSEYDSKLSIRRKSTSGGTARPGDVIKNFILVENSGDSDLYDIEVADKMKDQDGGDMGSFLWPIGHMPEGESAVIEYEMMISDPGRPLTVTSSVSAQAKDSGGDDVESRKLSSIFSILIPTAYGAADQDSFLPHWEEVIAPAEGPGKILGEETAADVSRFPLWAWILAIAIYFMTINRAFAPKVLAIPRVGSRRIRP